MTKKEVLLKIKEYALNLEKELSTTTDEIKFFENIQENYSLMQLEKIKEIAPADFALLYLNAANKDIPFEEIKNIIMKNKGIFTENTLEKVAHLINLITENVEKDRLESLKNYLVPNRTPKIKDAFSKKFYHAKKMDILLSTFDEKPEDFSLLVDLILKDPETNVDALVLSYFMRLIKEEWKEINSHIDAFEIENNVKLTEHERRKNILENLKANYKIPAFETKLQVITDYYYSVINQAKIANRKKKNSFIACSNFEKKYNNETQKEEITNIDLLIDNIPDEELRLEILKLIYQHNLPYYENLAKEHQQLSNNSILNYKSLFQEKSISIDDATLDVIRCNPLEDVKEMLNILTRMEITDKDFLITVLKISDLKTLFELNELRMKGFINKEFLINKPNLFAKENDDLSVLKKNIENLQEKNISPMHLAKDPAAFLVPNKQFNKNINILESYSLLNSLKTSETHIFLLDDNLELKLDTILELGLENYLEEDLSLLNLPITVWKRVKIVQELNFPIENKESLIDILTTTNFFISDEQLDDYIFSTPSNSTQPIVEKTVESTKEELEILKQFSNTSRTYKVNGIIVSKNKVARSLASMKSSDLSLEEQVLNALLQGTTLDEEEYQTVKNNLVK